MHLLRFALALAALTAAAAPVRAQRCVAAGDMADNAAQRRYCGTSLIGGLGGTAGFGGDMQCLSQNDDGSSPRITITSAFPSGLRFFDTTHTSVFVNTNGNITFSDRLSTFTPAAFPVAARPMIAPFWADVDTRMADGRCNEADATTCTSCTPCYATAANQVWWYLEPGRAIFTWDEVGYYRCQDDRRMSFQLILTAAPGCGGEGDFDVEFRFNRCEWETGGASGGTGGFGGTPAQSGFDAGNSRDYVMIMGSRMANISRRLCEESNVAMPGIWRFQIRRGTIMCPEAGTPCDTGMLGACGEGRISCDCSGASCTTSCVPQVTPRAERCNALDDDCDGTPDDTAEGALCGPEEVCERGRCVARCFEGGCATGFACTATGCVEEACVGVECPPGERCRGGSCSPACDGVVCPEPQTCISGVCVDTCAGIMCDDCTACSGGSCVTRCTLGGTCASGEECETSSGRCVPSGCSGVTCSAGTTCRGGTCVDACDGAVCPEGERCSMGTCMLIPVDAGVPIDAGPRMEIDAQLPDFDAGIVTPEVDGGRPRPRRSAGCCTVAPGAEGDRREGSVLLALGVLALLAARARRR